jgi:hypothetical protein
MINSMPPTRKVSLSPSLSTSWRWLLLALALLAAAGGVRWFNRLNASQGYSPKNVVIDHPWRAVHEAANDFTSGATVPQPANTAGAQPKLFLPLTFHDFGAVRYGARVSKEFVIGNQGSAPLVIQRAYTTCGCTVADFTASTIPPGKAALITVTWDSSQHAPTATTIRRGVIILSNDPTQPQSEIWIQATIKVDR